MSDFRTRAQDPEHRRTFEKLLLLAAQRGDADLVAERLSWGVDPNCTTKSGRTPLMANVVSFCPSVAAVEALLAAGADPAMTDQAVLTALDYARRKLMRLESRPRRRPRKSPSLDENGQLVLTPREQAELQEMRETLGDDALDYIHVWWESRLRAARKVFNDPDQVERIVELLEASEGREGGSGPPAGP